MSHFVSGMIMMGYIVAGIFFLRFWRDSRDRLFAMFGLAFFILAVQRVGIEFVASTAEEKPLWYFVRLAAFVIIVVAIVDKNRKK